MYSGHDFGFALAQLWVIAIYQLMSDATNEPSILPAISNCREQELIAAGAVVCNFHPWQEIPMARI